VKISVVTVCFNSQRTIADTLLSVLSQDYAEVEHIVVDGGSRDGTLEVINRTPNRITKLITEPDRGIYDAMNKGIALATGDVVGFLNSDDIYADSEALRKVAASLSVSAVDACYGDIVFVAADDPERIVRYWRPGDYAPGRVAKGWMPPHPTFFVRRSAYKLTGGFDLSYRLQGDYEMAIRLLEKQKLRLVYLPETLVRMRMGGASNSSIGNVIRGNQEAYRAAKTHGLARNPLFMVCKVLTRIPQYFARPISS
jgi:glycosyltransferase involved in cell wall biosynthesis